MSTMFAAIGMTPNNLAYCVFNGIDWSAKKTWCTPKSQRYGWSFNHKNGELLMSTLHQWGGFNYAIVRGEAIVGAEEPSPPTKCDNYIMDKNNPVYVTHFSDNAYILGHINVQETVTINLMVDGKRQMTTDWIWDCVGTPIILSGNIYVPSNVDKFIHDRFAHKVNVMPADERIRCWDASCGSIGENCIYALHQSDLSMRDIRMDNPVDICRLQCGKLYGTSFLQSGYIMGYKSLYIHITDIRAPSCQYTIQRPTGFAPQAYVDWPP